MIPCSGPLYRTAAFSPSRWQRAHSLGMFVAKVGDEPCSRPRVPCVPWHSVHEGAFGSPSRRSLPCRLRTYCCAISVWHAPQSTFLAIVSQGRRRDTFTPEWHCAQATFACLEAWCSFSSTNIDRPSLALSAPSWWHLRQSASAMPWV